MQEFERLSKQKHQLTLSGDTKKFKKVENRHLSGLSPQQQLPYLHGQKQHFHFARGYYLQPYQADVDRVKIRARVPKFGRRYDRKRVRAYHL